MSTIYDRIGGSYNETRRQDPRIAASIRQALGDARSVLNVGAGAGAYEPSDREVLAVEPSATMIAQRPRRSAPVIRAGAESLPFQGGTFDAALAVNTVHHWTDPRAGLRELRRIARKRIVVFLRDPDSGGRFWLTEDYLPALDPSRRISAVCKAIIDEFPSVNTCPVPLARDCVDGLFSAYWARPEMYLESEVRRNISNFALEEPVSFAEGLASLQADLHSGAWDRKYGHLRALSELDLGHRLLIAELA